MRKGPQKLRKEYIKLNRIRLRATLELVDLTLVNETDIFTTRIVCMREGHRELGRKKERGIDRKCVPTVGCALLFLL